MSVSDDMKNLGASMQSVARDADSAARSVGNFGDSTKNTGGNLKKGADAAKGLGDQVKGLAGEVNKLNTKFMGLANTLDNVKNIALSVFGGRALIQSVAGYGKSLFDLSRTAQATGRSFGDMKRSLEDINRTTALSKQEAADFFQTVDSGVTGIRMLSSDISALAKTLHDEFGPSLKDATDAFKDLAAIQKEDMFLFERLREGMGTDEMNAYGAALIFTGKATREQMETLVRVNAARGKNAVTITKEEEQNRKYIQTIEMLEKAFKDLILAVGKPLADLFTELTPHLTAFATKLTHIIEQSKGMGDAIKGAAKVGLMIAGVVVISKAVSVIVGGIMGIVNLIKSLFMGKTIQPVAVTNWPPGMAAPGGAAGAGGMGKWGKAARFGGAAMVVGYGGMMLSGAIKGDAEAGSTRSRVGAGVSGVSGVATGALTGAALGSLVGPIGTIVGGIVGGLGGLVASLADFDEAINGVEKSLKNLPPPKVYADFNAFLSQEKGLIERTMGTTDKYQLEAQFELVKESFGKTGSLGDVVASAEGNKEVRNILRAMGRVQELQKKGINVADKTQAVQGVIERNLAEALVEKEAKRRGITDEKERAKFVEVQTKDILAGRIFSEAGQQFVRELEKGPKGAAFQRAARGAREEQGLKDIGVLQIAQQAGAERAAATAAGRRFQLYFGMVEFAKELSAALDIQSTTEQKLADAALKYEINIDKAAGHLQRSMSQTGRRLELEREMLTVQTDQFNKQLAVAQLALRTEKSVITRKTLEREIEMIGAAQATARGKVLALEVSLTDQSFKLAQIRERELEFMESEVGVLNAQLGLVDSLYGGMGPRIAIQGQLMQKYKEQHDEIAKIQQALIAIRDDENRSVDDRRRAQELLNKQEVKRLGMMQKQADLAKGLRDQYVDAITAFTQVEGAFSKFIITKEQGFGKALTEFQMTGGFKTGGLGPGLTEQAYQYQAGGGLQMTSPEVFSKFITGVVKSAKYLPGGDIAGLGAIYRQTPGGEDAAAANMLMGQGGTQLVTDMSQLGAGTVFTALRALGTGGVEPGKMPGQGANTEAEAAANALMKGNEPMANELSAIHQTIIKILELLEQTGGLMTAGPGAGMLTPKERQAMAAAETGGIAAGFKTGGTAGSSLAAPEVIRKAAGDQSEAAKKQVEVAEAAKKAIAEEKLRRTKENIERIIDYNRNEMAALSRTLGKDAPRPGTAAHAQVVKATAAVAVEEVRRSRSVGMSPLGPDSSPEEAERFGIRVRFQKEKGIYGPKGERINRIQDRMQLLRASEAAQFSSLAEAAQTYAVHGTSAIRAKRGIAIGSVAGGETMGMVTGTGGAVFNINVRGDNRNEIMRDLMNKVDGALDSLGSPTGVSAHHHGSDIGPSSPQ